MIPFKQPVIATQQLSAEYPLRLWFLQNLLPSFSSWAHRSNVNAFPVLFRTMTPLHVHHIGVTSWWIGGFGHIVFLLFPNSMHTFSARFHDCKTPNFKEQLTTKFMGLALSWLLLLRNSLCCKRKVGRTEGFPFPDVDRLKCCPSTSTARTMCVAWAITTVPGWRPWRAARAKLTWIRKPDDTQL